MAHENKQIKSVRDLSGASICVQQGTTSELSMADFFGANNIPFTPLDFATLDEAITAYDGGRCAAVSARASSLYAERMKLSHPGENIILPEIISKEPLSPAVRQGDDEWFDIV
jgi:general L-amino acid transport system substrate-binding protein